MTTKRKYKHYQAIRNYAEHKMKIRLSHSCNWEEIHDIAYELESHVIDTYTYNDKFFFFNNETDALYFRLRYGE
jgi:hypothetical protein